MAVLLVGMGVAAILMTAALPVWKQMARREKEAELEFRGKQYVRAIGLFQKRSGPGVLPPNLDVLISGHFLRKKFKDPITNDDFDLLSPTQAAGPATGLAAVGRGAGQQPNPPAQGTGAVIGVQSAATTGRGGIIGVASKSREPSLRIYNGRTRYNEWQFVFVPQTQAPTAPGGPGSGPGRGAQPTGAGGFPGGQGRQGQGGQGQPATGRGFNAPAGMGVQPPPPQTSPIRPPGR